MNKSLKKLVIPIATIFLFLGLASATELQNIETITPQGTADIDITGNVNMNGNPIKNPSNVDGVDLDNPGNAITINSNQYEVASNSIYQDELNTGNVDNRYLNRGGDSMTGDLNLNNNNLDGGVISPFSWIGSEVPIIGHYNNFFIAADERWTVTQSSSCRSGTSGDMFDHSWSSNCGLNDADLPASFTIDFNINGIRYFSNDMDKMMLYFVYGRSVSEITIERYYTGGDDTCNDGNESWETIQQETGFSGSRLIVDVIGDGQTCKYRVTLDGNSAYTDDIRFSSWNMYLQGDRSTFGGAVRKSGDSIYGNINMEGYEVRNLQDPDDPQDAATRGWVNDNDNVEDYHDLADVLNDGNSANQNIDMNGNSVNSVDSLELTGSGTILSATDGSVNTISLNNDNIEGVNGISINDAGTDGDISFTSGARIYQAPLDDSNSDGYLQLVNDGGIAFEPGSDGSTAATFTTGNDLDMRGNNINGVNSIDGGGSVDFSGNNILINNNGDYIGDSSGAQFEFEGGGVELQNSPAMSFGDGPPSSGLDMGGYNIQDSTGQLTLSSAVGITGNLDMNGDNINNIGNIGNVDSTNVVGNLNSDMIDGENLQDIVSDENTNVMSNDWNTLTEPAIYGVSGSSWDGSNQPTSAYSYGHLIVTENNNRGIMQMYVSHHSAENGAIWIRSGWDNGGWDAWHAIPTREWVNSNDATEDYHDLTNVLNDGNNANQNIDMDHNNIVDLGGGSASINGGDIRFQPASSGGTAGLSFESNGNSGSDGAWLTWYDDNDNYNYWGDSSENGAIVLGSTNDERNDVSDVTVLKSPAAAVIDAPELRMDGASVNMVGNSVNNADDVETNEIYDDNDGELDVSDHLDIEGHDLRKANNIQTNQIYDNDDGQLDIADDVDIENHDIKRATDIEVNDIYDDDSGYVRVQDNLDLNGEIELSGNVVDNAGRLDLNSGAIIDSGPADYGSIRVRNHCEGGWCGVNLEGQSDYVLMTDNNGDDVGLYDDDNNNWLIRYDASASDIDNYQELDLNNNNIVNVNQLGDVDSTSHVNNLNADLLDGQNVGNVQTHSGDDLTDNTVDSSEIQNGANFRFNGGLKIPVGQDAYVQ